MTYQTPKLVLVGSAKGLVLGVSPNATLYLDSVPNITVSRDKPKV
jgi:hypothetical protein